MLLTVENEDGNKEFNGIAQPEGFIDLPFVPCNGTVLRFDPPTEKGGTTSCFIEIWGTDVHMGVPSEGKIPTSVHVHIFGKPEHRTTKEGLIALGKFLST